MSQRSRFHVFLIILLLVSICVFVLQLISLTHTRSNTTSNKKFAYVFYVTDPEYICYASVNADRLVDDLNINPDIDIVFIYPNDDWEFKAVLENCAHPKVKLIQVQEAPAGLTEHDNYAKSYVRFEAFKLIQYDRIMILDADGVILKSMDHLFHISLDGHPIAATYADYSNPVWLSSVLIIVEPSPELYDRVTGYLNEQGIEEVAKYANGSHYDMDILNYVFHSGRDAKIISSDHVMLDSTFFQNQESNFELPHYVHFTAKKPLLYVETRKEDYDMPEKAKQIFSAFWKGFDKRCAKIFEKQLQMALDEYEVAEKARKQDEEFVKKFKGI